MYSLLQRLGAKRALTTQAPPMIGAGVVAELFYKFHSFTLECVAFLATWFAFDFVAHLVTRRVATTRPESL